VNARLRPLGFRPVDLEPAESEQILVGDTIDLDGRRGMAAQKATRLRRQLSMVYAADAALRKEELDILLAAAHRELGKHVCLAANRRKAKQVSTRSAWFQHPSGGDPGAAIGLGILGGVLGGIP
jgi:hypothetical protein